MAKVSMSGLNKFFGSFQALHDVSLDIPDGEFTVFVGPSGCGKSTLLRAIAGLEDVSSGSICLDDRDVTTMAPSDRDVAMVFQSYALYPHMTVRQNMEFGMKVGKVPAEQRAERVAEAARILQLEDYLDRRPSQLSGGQRQRVAIGRAIVKQPKVFLFDEPLSNLDAKLRIQMRIELEALHRQLSVTMIYVTHDQVEAMTMANTIVVLNEGRIEQVGSPLELYHHPKTEFVAGFIGAPSMNFINVEGGQDGVRYGGVDIPLGKPAANAARLGIRPEHVQLGAPGQGAFAANVLVKEALGGETFLYTETEGGDQVVIKMDGDDTTAIGDNVSLSFPAERIHLFTAEGAAL
ncbi:MAG: ABC transporter ATP-binding protein [Hyphomicrobiales bacterium]|nr:MAG: ABC transporter ATP-binding protein [Hyphomicrobiales bacterium]